MKRILLAVLAWCLSVVPSAARDIFPRIINGLPVQEFLDGEFEQDFAPVGIVGSEASGAFCTGTLISPFHVLTAAHCADVIESHSTGLFQVGGELYSTVQVHIHPRYNPNTLANDIAILELAEPVLNVEPAQISRTRPRVGDDIMIVGFGQGGDAENTDGTFGNKAAGITTIQYVSRTRVIWIFDDPEEANTAPGDSGGPGFVTIAGELYIASVTSGGTVPGGLFGDIAFNTRVDAFANWIDDIVVEEEPEPEPEPEPDDPPQDNPPPADDPPAAEDPPQTNRPNRCPPGAQNRPHRRPGMKPQRPRPPRRPHRRPRPPRRPGWWR